MTGPLLTEKRLAAARDLSLVAAFCALVFLGARAVLRSPFLQKERLDGREARQDMDRFFSVLEKTHPALLSRLNAQEYAALKTSAASDAAAGMDEFSRITVRDLAWILYRRAAALGDPSTKVLWRPQRRWKDPELKYPPFSVALRAGEFTVDAALDPALAGSAVLELDGRPFRAFAGPALERISAGTAAQREYLFCRDQAFWWDFSARLASLPKFRAKFRSPAGLVYSRELGAVTAWEFRRLAWKPAPERTMLYAQKKVAWFNADGLPWTRKERGVLASFLRQAGRHGARDLVLDLRAAADGDARTADYLLAGLTKLLRERPGLRVWALTGPGSGDAAAYFAARFRELKAGELLGEAAGGTPGHFGEPERFELAASGIAFEVATRAYPGPAAPPEPDVRLTPAALLRYKGGGVQAFLLDRIERARAGRGE